MSMRSNVTDPFSFDLFQELFDYPYSYPRSSSSTSTSTSRPSSGGLSQHGTTSFFNALVDWKVTPEAHVFKVDLPGIKKEEVKVEVHDGIMLQISGERNREKQENTDTWHCTECNCGEFLRKFLLPANAKTDQIKAAMVDGVLTVTVPNEKVKKPGVKSVQISG